jgi:hypothetical protein
MKFYLTTLFFFFGLSLFLLSSCTDNYSKPIQKQEEAKKDTVIYNPFENIHLTRQIMVANDTLVLAPHHIYLDLELIDVERGMFDALVFKTNCKDLPKLTLKSETIFTPSEYGSGQNNSVFVKLESPLNSSGMQRKILYNKPYHAILCYQVDGEAASGKATCDYSSYRIIDIVPKGQLFAKQNIKW